MKLVHHQIEDHYLHSRTNGSHINWRYGPVGTSKQPRDVFNSHKTAALIKHQERTFYSPMPRYQSAARENNGPLKIVIHKHHLALFSALGETRQTQMPGRSPVCVAAFSTCAGAAKGPGPFLECSADLCRSLSKTHPRRVPGLGPIRPISNNKTQGNATKQGRGGR